MTAGEVVTDPLFASIRNAVDKHGHEGVAPVLCWYVDGVNEVRGGKQKNHFYWEISEEDVRKKGQIIQLKVIATLKCT